MHYKGNGCTVAAGKDGRCEANIHKLNASNSNNTLTAYSCNSSIDMRVVYEWIAVVHHLMIIEKVCLSFSWTILPCRALYLSLLNWRGSVQSQVGVAMVVEEDLQHVQHPCHLGEDEGPGREKKHFMIMPMQASKQLWHETKFFYGTCVHRFSAFSEVHPKFEVFL